jgi:sugar/nucleoside kinase (ribokinase family)
LNDPFHVSLNRKENLIFSADTGANVSAPGVVTVYRYPSFKYVTTIGAGNGITSAFGVAISPDATF